jgi:hypothetical protein
MSTRVVRALPWALVALAVALLLAAEILAGVTATREAFGFSVFIWAIALVFGATGSLIATRQPGNPIGWLFLVASVSAGVSSLSGAYADYYVAERQGPPALGEAAAVYGDLSWMPFILLPATFLLALFPDGRLLSRRWRPVAWCAAIGIGGAFVIGFIKPGPIADQPQMTNPIGVNSPLVSPLEGLTLLMVAIGMVGSSISLVLRFRRSRGEQRQQIKWLALAGAIAVVTIVFGVSVYDVLGDRVADGLMMLSVMGLPVAAGIAILRYRLYDIDVVINRTLVYGALTAMLAAVYLVSVLLLQLLLESFTQGSGLAVAASTLATAALVRPARSRIQAVVDRRFFRRKYDAAQTLAAFGARLRDEVDLDAVQTYLRAVVAETMQPSHVSLWTPTRVRGDG